MKKLTTELFIKKAQLLHGNIYDYSLTQYCGYKSQLKIICKKHGIFEQRPNSHLQGHGCSVCTKNQKMTTETFIRKAKQIHGNAYDYSLVDYKNNNTTVKIKCLIHGGFEQRPSKHLSAKQGCPKCVSNVSKLETAWLDSLHVPLRQIRIGKYTVDGYCPATKTIYEFNGDFWHGNPNYFNSNEINQCTKCTFGQLYQKTIKKERALKRLGYTVISIWGSEFNPS